MIASGSSGCEFCRLVDKPGWRDRNPNRVQGFVHKTWTDADRNVCGERQVFLRRLPTEFTTIVILEIDFLNIQKKRKEKETRMN